MRRAPFAILAGMGLTVLAGLTAVLFPPMRDAIGITVPGASDLAASEALFDRALDGGTAATQQRYSQPAGLTVLPMDQLWQGTLLKEPDGQCEGLGIYLVREPHTAVSLALTAPHRGADLHTGTLAAQLFTESNAAAAAWNSAPRRPTSDCPSAIDLARAGDHPFTIFALAFAKRHPQGRIVQLHGFDRARRRDAASSEASIIVSNGTSSPDKRLLDLADCLSLAFNPLPVRVFPLETSELGALSNAQGSALRDAGFDGFVHLEMAVDLRLALTRDAQLRAKLLGCLVTGLRG
ncbi:MAG: hypothetical protein HKO05_09790 [Erythrobacter sp.]|nr:hypothetical protein [Erythrobacter sp.]